MKEEKIKEIQTTEYNGFYYLMAVAESGRLYLGKYELGKDGSIQWEEQSRPLTK